MAFSTGLGLWGSLASFRLREPETPVQIRTDPSSPNGRPQLLRRSIIEDVREGERVLDMGTGWAINAILAASRSTSVLAVDMNPFAIEAGKKNTYRNQIADRIEFLRSGLFQNISEKFDPIIFTHRSGGFLRKTLKRGP